MFPPTRYSPFLAHSARMLPTATPNSRLLSRLRQPRAHLPKSPLTPHKNSARSLGKTANRAREHLAALPPHLPPFVSIRGPFSLSG